MSRLPRLPITELNPEQEALMKSITGSERYAGKPVTDFTFADGSMRGPFNPWLHSPEAGERQQQLGQVLRFRNAMKPSLRELAIICVARHWRSQYEWYAHAAIGLREGLPQEVIDAIYNDEEPPETEPGVKAVAAFARETLTNHNVSDATYEAALAVLGDQGIVDLVSTVGYYCMVSATLNVFQVPVPDGVEPPFKD